MTDQQRPVLIELTKVFDTYVNYFDGGNQRFKTGAVAEETTVNANAIEEMEVAKVVDKDKLKFHPSTEITKVSGEHILVKETKAEIRQKIADAMKP